MSPRRFTGRAVRIGALLAVLLGAGVYALAGWPPVVVGAVALAWALGAPDASAALDPHTEAELAQPWAFEEDEFV